MCLAIPCRLITRQGAEGVAELHGNQIRVHLPLVPEAAPGDWLLIHAGFAIQIIDAQSAQETWALLQQVQELPPDDPSAPPESAP